MRTVTPFRRGDAMGERHAINPDERMGPYHGLCGEAIIQALAGLFQIGHPLCCEECSVQAAERMARG